MPKPVELQHPRALVFGGNEFSGCVDVGAAKNLGNRAIPIVGGTKSRERAEAAAEPGLGLVADRLFAEGQHSVRREQLGKHTGGFGVEGKGEVETGNLGADGWRQLLESERHWLCYTTAIRCLEASGIRRL